MADPSAVSAAPFIADLKPYIDVFVQAVIVAALSLAAAKLQQWTNIKINETQLAKLKSAAATEAGAMVAAAEDNLSKQKITVGSPVIVAAADRIAKALPDAAAAVGATPEALQKFVAGEIGKLQAQAGASQTVSPTQIEK